MRCWKSSCEDQGLHALETKPRKGLGELSHKVYTLPLPPPLFQRPLQSKPIPPRPFQQETAFSSRRREAREESGRCETFVPLHLCPLIADMSSDVMWYSGQSYPAIYRATRGLGLVKRLRCSYVFKQKYSFKGVGISGKFDQYFPVTDLRKTCCSHDHCEPDHWPLILLSLKFNRSLTQSDRIVVIT